MEFGIFTPSHSSNLDFLKRLKESLIKQTYKNWKWSILVNGDALSIIDEIKAEMIDDDRILVNAFKEDPFGIGELKREAIKLLTSDYLVEVDHDDELIDTCLETLNKEAKDYELTTGSLPDFMYSDACLIKADGSFHLFDPAFGWEHHSETINGKPYICNKSFELSPSSLANILFAPDHVRVYKRDTYWKVGGHNRKLAITDDYELTVKLYCNDASFLYIPKILYLYHYLDGDNSHSKNYEENFRNVKWIHDQNREAILMSFCRRNKLEAIDLGSRHNKPEGYVGIDIVEGDGVDVVANAFEHLPFNDNTVGIIRAIDFMEHIPTNKINSFMNECYRVLAPGGWMITATPLSDSRAAIADPTHVSFWNDMKFLYFTSKEKTKYNPDFKGNFRVVKVDEMKDPYCGYVYADLIADKNNMRLPGLDYISNFHRVYQYTRLSDWYPARQVMMLPIK